MDYIHYNPVKHGYVNSPGNWEYSSFVSCVKRGLYKVDWGLQEPERIKNMELE